MERLPPPLPPGGQPSADERELRDCIRDLTSLFAIPTLWSGKSPEDILQSFCQVLESMMPLDLVYVASEPAGPGSHVSVLRIEGAWHPVDSAAAASLVAQCRAARASEAPVEIADPRLGALRLLRFDLGFFGRGGQLCVASRHADFPLDGQRVVLRAAVSLLGGALHTSRILEERERAARAKDEFLAMLGHELRNPLSPIITALQLIKMRSNGQFAREQDIIDRQLAHLIRLVDDLLDIARVTSGKVALRKADISLRDAVAKALETVGPLMQERRHILSVELVPADIPLHADLVRVSQVLQNLLINAAKYTDPGGKIGLRARVEGAEVRIGITDNGSGIDAVLLPRVFDLFTQGAMQIDRSQGGLGIGLALVKSLVGLHGGRVAAASAGRGQGSEFTVWLPIVGNAPDARGAGPESRISAAPEIQEHVLVVDDNHDAATSLVELLRVVGYSADVAHDGAGALAAFDRRVPQTAILDIGLPGMNGYELATRIRAQYPGKALRLIALTGYGQDADRERALEAGFDLHLVKPIDIDRLLSHLSREELSETRPGTTPTRP